MPFASGWHRRIRARRACVEVGTNRVRSSRCCSLPVETGGFGGRRTAFAHHGLPRYGAGRRTDVSCAFARPAVEARRARDRASNCMVMLPTSGGRHCLGGDASPLFHISRTRRHPHRRCRSTRFLSPRCAFKEVIPRSRFLHPAFNF